MSKKSVENSEVEEAFVTQNIDTNKKTIEELCKELEIKDSIITGVKIVKGWRNGKVLTKSELETAINEFLNKTV